MSQTGAGKTKLSFDAADLANSDQVGSNLLAGGVVITATGTSVDVNITNQLTQYLDGAVWSAGSFGQEMLAIRKDAAGPLTGVADGDFSPLQTNDQGELKVTATVNFAGDYAEDSGHVSGDVGLFSLQVRNSNQSAVMTSATLDYASLSVDDRGAAYVKDIANKSNLQQIIAVGTTALLLPAVALTDRSSMMIQMLSGGALYLGSATVTNSGAARGFKIGDGGFVTLDVGPSNAIYGIANAAGKDVMVWEFA